MKGMDSGALFEVLEPVTDDYDFTFLSFVRFNPVSEYIPVTSIVLKRGLVRSCEAKILNVTS